MAIQEQVVGSTGKVAEVKEASQAPTVADGAMVVMSRPDDPILAAVIAQTTDVLITGQGGQTALGQNIVLPAAGAGWYDVSSYRSMALQIVPAGTITAGVITLEGSNDGTNAVLMGFIDKASPANAPVSSVTLATATSRYLVGKVLFKYFRARISTGITGTGGSVQAFSNFIGESADLTIQPVRPTDGTNTMPTLDSAARRGYVQVTDGTSAMSVKAASTSAVAADLAGVVAISPNLPVPSVHTLESAATTNATSVKASAGRITALVLSSPLVTATVRFLKLYNKASAPTVGSDVPVITIPFPTVATNGGIVVVPISGLGLYFSTGIAYAITALSTTGDTTAVAAGDVKVFMNYI